MTGKVDGDSVRANTQTSRDWPSHGLDYSETRFSRLAQISVNNVKALGLVWTYDLESTRGVEATPLVVDGIMYVTASWSVVHAVDVRTGQRLWTYDPKVSREAGYKGCCDVVNRGVALHKGKVYVGAYDGRLIALDAATGTVGEGHHHRSRTLVHDHWRAPRVFKGPSATAARSTACAATSPPMMPRRASSSGAGSRCPVIPPSRSRTPRWATPPRPGTRAASTGKPAAGKPRGTPWCSIPNSISCTSAPATAPWARSKRSPAGGDNLYLASIVALNPDTGQYVWHYQDTPGENWDFTSTQPMILADLKIQDRTRKVILHAPKNGFFYVIDRTNGKFISAKNFVDVNWATGYDKNGRPIERWITSARRPSNTRGVLAMKAPSALALGTSRFPMPNHPRQGTGGPAPCRSLSQRVSTGP